MTRLSACVLALLAASLPSRSAAQACAEGRLATEATAGRCCWPGQSWDPSAARCSGAPACPEGRIAHGDECVASQPIAESSPPSPGVAVVDPRGAWLARFEPPPDGWLELERVQHLVSGTPRLAREPNGTAALAGALVFLTGYGSALAFVQSDAGVTNLREASACRNEGAGLHAIPLVGAFAVMGLYSSCTFVNYSNVTVTYRQHHDMTTLDMWFLAEAILQGAGLAMVITALAGGHDRLDVLRIPALTVALGPRGVSVTF